MAGGLWIKAESVAIQIEALGPLHLGSQNVCKKCFYIMGHNLKNARNRKSILEIGKWPPLRALKI